MGRPAYFKIIILVFFYISTSFLRVDLRDLCSSLEKTGVSPSNEAVMLDDQGVSKIFYINRPGDADKILSRDWSGREWGEPQEEFSLPGQAYYALQVVDRGNGDLVCVFHVFGKGDNGYRGRHLDLWVNIREDGKWGNPFKIYDGYVGSIRGLKRLTNGRLLLTFAKAVPEREEPPQTGMVDYGWNNIISMYSDDDGKSWKRSKNEIEIEIDNTKPTRYGGVEPDIVELKDGTLWMLIRTTHGFLYQSYSSDGGISWEKPSATSFISSDSPASILRTKDGRLVLFWNSCRRWDNPHSYAMGGREVLHAAISSDDGLTWEGAREVAFEKSDGTETGDRGTAYPSAIDDGKGRILFVTGQGQSRAVYRMSPDWLMEKSQIRYISFNHIPDRGNGAVPEWLGDTLAMPSSAGLEAVVNLPISKKGSVEIGPFPAKELFDLGLSLTDHFSSPSDSAAFSASVFNIRLSEILDEGEVSGTLTLRLDWDVTEEDGWLQITSGGNSLGEFKSQRFPAMGLNYLRVKSSAGFNDKKWVVPVIYKDLNE